MSDLGISSPLTNLSAQEMNIINNKITRNDTVSGFEVRSTFLRRDGRVHGAIDIGTPTGTKLSFTLPNTIFVRKDTQSNGFGLYIVLRNIKEKKDFYFAHLQNFSPYINSLKLGVTIDINELLGNTGSSGAARTLSDQEGKSLKSHLHFEVNDLETRNRVDYNPYLKYLKLV